MHKYEARIHWQRDGAAFTDNRYSRGHRWSFDGGTTVPASSSPALIPLPLSVAEAVDPEEALVASASSCHMLWFLSLAAKRGLVVDSYQDEAYGQMDKRADGKTAFTRIVLRPQARFVGETPGPEDLAGLHHRAHEQCFIANSLTCEVAIEPA